MTEPVTTVVRLYRYNGEGSDPRWTIVDEVQCFNGQPERAFRTQFEEAAGEHGVLQGLPSRSSELNR